jgi:GNAT superfamily N-acetyltransferase
MTAQWAVRPFEDADIDAVIRLFQLRFPNEDTGSLRERHSWLARNPYGCYQWVVVSDGKVIGYEGRLLAPLQLVNRRTFAGVGFDLVVAPAHRGKGIARALVSTSRRETGLRGAEVSLGFTNAGSSRVLLAEGVLLGDLQVMFYPNSTLGRLALRIWRARYPLKVDPRVGRPAEQAHLSVEASNANPADLHRFALLDEGFEGLHLIHTVQWLDWCCLQRPKPEMRFVIVRVHGETIGYVMYSAQRFHGLLSIGKIEHVAFLRAVPLLTERHALVKVLISVGDIDLWWSRAFPDSQFGRLLSAIGFSLCSSFPSRVVVTIPSEHATQQVLDCSRWYLSPSDMF